MQPHDELELDDPHLRVQLRLRCTIKAPSTKMATSIINIKNMNPYQAPSVIIVGQIEKKIGKHQRGLTLIYLHPAAPAPPPPKPSPSFFTHPQTCARASFTANDFYAIGSKFLNVGTLFTLGASSTGAGGTLPLGGVVDRICDNHAPNDANAGCLTAPIFAPVTAARVATLAVVVVVAGEELVARKEAVDAVDAVEAAALVLTRLGKKKTMTSMMRNMMVRMVARRRNRNVMSSVLFFSTVCTGESLLAPLSSVDSD